MSAADLVVFGEDWGRHPSSSQHLIKRLAAAGRRVVWVNSIGLRRPRLGRADLVRAWTKLRSALGPGVGLPSRRPATPGLAPEPVPDGITVVAPLAVPWPGNRLVGRLNRWLLAGRVRQAMARAGISQPVLWLSLPTAVDVVGALGERAVVYYCGDDFGALAGVDHAGVLRAERRLAAVADLILAASPLLAAKFPAARTLLLPHGADIDLFATPAPRPPDLPPGLVAGFYGSLADWLDQDLVAALAVALPTWQFVLIGEVRVAVDRLRAQPNIRLLGPRPHGALPGYAQHWTVSLLPFLDNAQIRASNPLKLREYLAAGTPVVSTPFPAVEPYAAHVRIAAGADAFAAAILAAAAEAAGERDRRRLRVAGETWDARAAEAAGRIDHL